jgi:hypothetical protein
MTWNTTWIRHSKWPLLALFAVCALPTLSRAAVILSVDVNDTTSAALTESGFQPFLRDTNPATYGAQTMTISGIGFTFGDHDRLRATPADSGAFTQGELLRDFVFAPNAAAYTSGLNVRVQGLAPFGVYNGSIWSFDTSSDGTRVADWAANDIIFRENYTFDGRAEPPSPASNDVYRMDFSFIASEAGEVLIKGRRDALSVNGAATPVADAGVFLNGLMLDHQSTLQINPSPVLSVDFGNGDVQPGFSAMVLPGATAAHSQAFGPQTVTVTGVDVNIDQRNRGTPIDALPFDQGALLRDFVFAGTGAAATTGLDVVVDGLNPNQQYLVSLWSFDTSSSGLRVADWTSNGQIVNENGRFDGTTLPATNDDYRFSFLTTADSLGKLLIAGRVDAMSLSPNAPNVFLNAMQIRAVVPEPTSLALAAFGGLAGLAMLALRRARG